MKQQVIFRDFQEQQGLDHNNHQAYAQDAFDTLVLDAVTASRRYAGFNVTKSAQTEVTVAPGRFYDAGGAVYERTASTVQSMLQYLAASSLRKVIISASGVTNDTDVEERDFLVNTETGETEPDSVAMTKSRDAQLTFTQGAESTDPAAPAIPSTHIAVAEVLLDTTQVVSITMLDNTVKSTEGLDIRTLILEAFKSRIEPRVDSLANDLADLANRAGQAGQQAELVRFYEEIARLKERAGLPDAYSQYGADQFLDPSESDFNDTQSLGWDARVEEGIRFPDANADEFELSIFSANDPNATLSNGFLLPKYTNELKIGLDILNETTGIAQYGFQTYDVIERTMHRERLRYGGAYNVCVNGWAWYNAGDPAPTNLLDFETELIARDPTWVNAGSHRTQRTEYWWHDSWTEEYWAFIKIDHQVTGAQVAQSFLVSNDMWASRLGFFVYEKAANEDIHVMLCELVNGRPSLDNTICKVTYPHASIGVGWCEIDIPATFLKKGRRYAMVLVSNADHKVGMTHGDNYSEGTFFYSTDGVYHLGDLTKDLLFRVYAAKFDSPQVTIELAPFNLDGGIRNIDLLAQMITPQSTELILEIRPDGVGDWVPLTPQNVTALNSAPPLCHARLRFVGTRDMHAGIKLTGSRCKLWRPKLAFTHISTEQTLAVASDDIYVKAIFENFDDTPHDLDCRIRDIDGAAWEDPDSVTTVLAPGGNGRYERTWRFQLAAAIDNFAIEFKGTTNSAANTFHVSERIHWSA